MHNNLSATLPPKPKSLKSKNNRRNRRRRRNYKQCSQSSTSSHYNQSNEEFTHQFSYSINPRSFDLWRKTYENIMSWQSEHQVNYWRNQAQIFRNVNAELWTKLQKYEGKNYKNSHKEDDKTAVYETSSSEEDDDIENLDNIKKSEIDEEYLKFLEITHKHQKDRELLQDKEDDNQKTD